MKRRPYTTETGGPVDQVLKILEAGNACLGLKPEGGRKKRRVFAKVGIEVRLNGGEAQ